MQNFKEWLDENAKKPPVILWFSPGDDDAARIAESLIEEGKTYQLSNRYSARYDIAQQPNQQNHSHVYLKGNEVCVVNTDGTPSHSSTAFSTLPSGIQAKMKSLKLVREQFSLVETASAKLDIRLPEGILASFWLEILSH